MTSSDDPRQDDPRQDDRDGDDWGPLGPSLRAALQGSGVDTTGKTLMQAVTEADVLTGQVPVESDEEGSS